MGKAMVANRSREIRPSGMKMGAYGNVVSMVRRANLLRYRKRVNGSISPKIWRAVFLSRLGGGRVNGHSITIIHYWPILSMKKLCKKYILLCGICLMIVYLFFFNPFWVGTTDTKSQKANYVIHYFLREKLDEFFQGYHSYPTTEQGLKILTEKTSHLGRTYLVEVPVDPWGNEYQYISPGIKNRNSYDLWTYGSDNKPGGEEEHSRDITSWD